ncbi:MAG: guanylate kinase [bacterium]
MQPTKLIILSAPTGSGKNTIANMFMAQDKRFEETISCTTRTPREGEMDGVHYYYINEDEFKERIKNGEFIEWEKIHNKWYYGTLEKEIFRILGNKKNPFLVIEVNGAMNIKKKFPNAILVFIKPNSLKNMEERIRRRAQIFEEEVKARLKTAKNELKMSKYYDYIVTNPEGHPEKGVEELKRIVEKYFVS